jgi:putative ABC transport system permease protein
MKFLPLVWSNLKRRKVRTSLTVLAMVASFFLFGVLMTLKSALSAGVEMAGAERLVVQNKVSIIQPLPEGYKARIAQVPGVEVATYASWFGGIYQDPKNFFAQIAVEPEAYLRIYPELVLPDEQKQAWLADRIGAVAGRDLAERFGWQVGDRIPIRGTFNRRKDGSVTWEFNLDGIYEGAKQSTDTSQFFFHHEYLSEARQGGDGLVGWYILQIDDPERAPEIAARVDERFANSPWETKTTTEKAFTKAFADQIGDLGAIVTAIAGAVFFTLLLVAGNTMAQSVRERTAELAVLKTLGFSSRLVFGLILAESLILALIGGGLGLLAAWAFTLGGDPTGGLLPVFYLPRTAVIAGLLFILLLGLATGLLPGVSALRLRIADALGRA